MNSITATQLEQWRTADRPFLLLNVLGKQAFDTEHIPGSKNVPVGRDDFANEVGRLAGTKDRVIVVYCASARCDASERAAKKLEQAGFPNVYDFEGGMEAWNESKPAQPEASGTRAS